LIDLGFHNALLSRRELSFIYDVGRILNLPYAEIKSMLNIRYLHFEKSKENNRRTKNSIGFTKNSLQHKKRKALLVLGLPTNTQSFDEVRRAYRNLARRHHPDRFHNSSEMEKQQAHERFTEINLAQDYLKEVLK
jgi:DnaJ-domain-containing protein 1